MNDALGHWRPELCFIDICGACNASCPYCVKGRGRQQQGRAMPVETFERVLEYIQNNRLMPTSGLIHLFNWGEPMLHPQIDDIIQVCGQYGLLAFISSNLIRLPKLSAKTLHLLTGVGVSLSGFSEDTYGRIHGKKLSAVLSNLDELYQMAVLADCPWRPHVIWHRYQFNEREKGPAKNYFRNRGMAFQPGLASLNGIDLTMDYFFDNNMPQHEREKIEQDLFADYIREILMLSRAEHYECPQWSYLTIDENARLQLCCGWSNTVKQSDLGYIFDIPAKEIQAIKRRSPLCERCIRLGIAKYGHSTLRNKLLDDYVSNLAHTSSGSVLDTRRVQAH